MIWYVKFGMPLILLVIIGNLYGVVTLTMGTGTMTEAQDMSINVKFLPHPSQIHGIVVM